MADVYAVITEADADVVETLATAMEVSAADPQHTAMVAAYLSDLSLPREVQALEVGCGTGAIARMLAGWPGVRDVVGVDPSPLLVARAESLAKDVPDLRFLVGDGARLELRDASFDLVVAHRVLSHVPEPERVLAEAFRVLRPGGALALFDGDYATITVAASEIDPLQACVRAFAPVYITDPWIARRLPGMVRAAGFVDGRMRSHGYVQVDAPDYMLGIVDRGADALVASGQIGAALGDALKAEGRRRVDEGSFYGHIAYASVTARKPQ